MKKYIIILIASLMATASMAHNVGAEEYIELSPLIEREFYQKAYDLIVGYSQNASLKKDIEREEFKLLFENTNVYVSNDLMGFLMGIDTLTVYRYMQELRKAESVEITISNLQKHGSIVDNGNVWLMEVTFDKSISILTKDYIYFDSKSFFGEDYHYIATISMEKEGERLCYISSLRPSGKWQTFPQDYRVLEMKEQDKRDKKLYINNKEQIRYNRYGQYILHHNDKVYYNRGEVSLQQIDSEGRKFQADYKDKHFRVRANIGFSLSGFNKVVGNNVLSLSGNNEFNFGVDFGYAFKSISKLQTSIFVGLGLSKNSITMNLPGQIEEKFMVTNPKLDEDGDIYERYYKVWGENGLSQKMDATDITIPLYIDLEYQFSALISGYADVGMRLQSSTAKPTATIDKYETWGVYPNYDNLIIRNCDETGKPVSSPVALNGFGLHESQSIDVDESGTSKSMAFDALLALGLRLNLNKSLALDAGVQYILGLSNSWKGEGSKASIFSYDGKDKLNLLRQTDGIKHNALQLKASLIFKF